MRIAVIDTETTGLDLMTHELIEIAFAVGEFDNDGKLVLIEALSAVFPCDKNEAESINGISPILSQSGTVELYAIVKSLLAVDVFVAHNAKFDKGFGQKFFAECPDRDEYASLMSKPWVCTVADYELDCGKSRKLTHVCADNGIFFTAGKHRAMIDVLMLAELVGKLGYERFIKAFERSKMPEYKLISMAPFAQKEEVKTAGFRWNPDTKQWTKNVKTRDVDALVKELSFRCVSEALI